MPAALAGEPPRAAQRTPVGAEDRARLDRSEAHRPPSALAHTSLRPRMGRPKPASETHRRTSFPQPVTSKASKPGSAAPQEVTSFRCRASSSRRCQSASRAASAASRWRRRDRRRRDAVVGSRHDGRLLGRAGRQARKRLTGPAVHRLARREPAEGGGREQRQRRPVGKASPMQVVRSLRGPCQEGTPPGRRRNSDRGELVLQSTMKRRAPRAVRERCAPSPVATTYVPPWPISKVRPSRRSVESSPSRTCTTWPRSHQWSAR